MHPEAHAFVAQAVAGRTFTRVAEFGSLDINGSVRDLFPGTIYSGVDLQDGPGVDVVADCTSWLPYEPVDCVVTCEALEHYEDWPAILASAHLVLKHGGTLIVTAAGPGRAPHSALDGGQLQDGEHYANVDPDDLRLALDQLGFHDIWVEQHGTDVRAVATR